MPTQKPTSHDKEIKEIWKLLHETDQIVKETAIQMKETDRQTKETRKQMKDTDQQMKETDRYLKTLAKESDKRIKELDELFKGQWGKLMEALVEGDLVKLLQNKGIQVDRTYTNVKGVYKGRSWEIDIIAVNGNETVVVEVKTTLRMRDVNLFIKKLNLFTTLNPEHKGKKIYGAVAYLKTNQSSDSYAGEQGLFVIKATGSSACITNSKNFKPKNFN